MVIRRESGRWGGRVGDGEGEWEIGRENGDKKGEWEMRRISLPV